MQIDVVVVVNVVVVCIGCLDSYVVVFGQEIFVGVVVVMAGTAVGGVLGGIIGCIVATLT